MLVTPHHALRGYPFEGEKRKLFLFGTIQLLCTKPHLFQGGFQTFPNAGQELKEGQSLMSSHIALFFFPRCGLKIFGAYVPSSLSNQYMP